MIDIHPIDSGGQFCDRGGQYRAAIFVRDEEQRKIAEQSKQSLQSSGRFKEGIATEILPLPAFYAAEGYHQDYYKKNPIQYRFFARLGRMLFGFAGTEEAKTIYAQAASEVGVIAAIDWTRLQGYSCASVRSLVCILVVISACSRIPPVTLPTPVADQPPAGSADRTLRVMTYNIKHGQSNAACTQPAAAPGQPPAPDCNLDLAGTIAVLRAHAPDVIALQEVDRFWARSGSLDEPAAIADALQMPARCFAPNLDHAADSHAGQPHQYGTAIVSRFPIATCTHTLLTTFNGWEQRGAIEAAIDVAGTRVRVFSTHLQANRTVGGVRESAEAQRLQQAHDLLGAIGAMREPVVVMGDFNATPAAPEIRAVTPPLIDAWARAGAGIGDTSPATLATNPTSRIDYIFVSPNVTIVSVSVPVDAQTRLASDHYPVVANLAIR